LSNEKHDLGIDGLARAIVAPVTRITGTSEYTWIVKISTLNHTL